VIVRAGHHHQVPAQSIHGNPSLGYQFFERLLRQVLTAPADEVPELTLQNTVAQQRAAALLENVDDLF
jgi:hypothetical protein